MPQSELIEKIIRTARVIRRSISSLKQYEDSFSQELAQDLHRSVNMYGYTPGTMRSALMELSQDEMTEYLRILDNAVNTLDEAFKKIAIRDHAKVKINHLTVIK